jgi:hypothetical protein
MLTFAKGFKGGFKLGVLEATTCGASVLKKWDEGVELVGETVGIIFGKGLHLNRSVFDIDPSEFCAEGLGIEIRKDASEGEVGGKLC